MKDPKVFLLKSTQFHNVVKTIGKLDINASQTFEMIKKYPDLLISNRYSILEKKIELLLESLNLKKSTIRNLIKRYPFILLKSYNSFVKKVIYFNNNLNLRIENIDIYPIIYVYNLNTDIIPRCELMKKYNKWIPFREAFSLDKEAFVQRIGANIQEYDKLVTESPLYERDIMFRYSKYLTY